MSAFCYHCERKTFLLSKTYQTKTMKNLIKQWEKAGISMPFLKNKKSLPRLFAVGFTVVLCFLLVSVGQAQLTIGDAIANGLRSQTGAARIISSFLAGLILLLGSVAILQKFSNSIQQAGPSLVALVFGTIVFLILSNYAINTFMNG